MSHTTIATRNIAHDFIDINQDIYTQQYTHIHTRYHITTRLERGTGAHIFEKGLLFSCPCFKPQL